MTEGNVRSRRHSSTPRHRRCRRCHCHMSSSFIDGNATLLAKGLMPDREVIGGCYLIDYPQVESRLLSSRLSWDANRTLRRVGD